MKYIFFALNLIAILLALYIIIRLCLTKEWDGWK